MNIHLEPDHDPEGTCWCHPVIVIHVPKDEPLEAPHDEQ